MVCEKNEDSSHDFMHDPIRLRVDGDWLTATGTTLGADNGIGARYCCCDAAAQSLLSVHGYHGSVKKS